MLVVVCACTEIAVCGHNLSTVFVGKKLKYTFFILFQLDWIYDNWFSFLSSVRDLMMNNTVPLKSKFLHTIWTVRSSKRLLWWWMLDWKFLGPQLCWMPLSSSLICLSYSVKIHLFVDANTVEKMLSWCIKSGLSGAVAHMRIVICLWGYSKGKVGRSDVSLWYIGHHNTVGCILFNQSESETVEKV